MTLLVHYSSDYVAAAHAFGTTRKAAWVADAICDDVSKMPVFE